MHTAKEPCVPADSEAHSPATGSVPIIRSDSSRKCANPPTIQSLMERLDKVQKELCETKSELNETKMELHKASLVTQGLREREVDSTTRLARLEGEHDRRSCLFRVHQRELQVVFDKHYEMEDRFNDQQSSMMTWTDFRECMAELVNDEDKTWFHIGVTSSMLQEMRECLPFNRKPQRYGTKCRRPGPPPTEANQLQRHASGFCHGSATCHPKNDCH